MSVDLPDHWRARARTLREYGAVSHAEAVERCDDELETQQAQRDEKAVPLREAVELTGYSESALYRMVQRGDLDDIADNGPPMFRLGDLPLKAKKLRSTSGAAAEVLGIYALEE